MLFYSSKFNRKPQKGPYHSESEILNLLKSLRQTCILRQVADRDSLYTVTVNRQEVNINRHLCCERAKWDPKIVVCYLKWSHAQV
jgi:hypothetical protein